MINLYCWGGWQITTFVDIFADMGCVPYSAPKGWGYPTPFSHATQEIVGWEWEKMGFFLKSLIQAEILGWEWEEMGFFTNNFQNISLCLKFLIYFFGFVCHKVLISS